MNNTTVRFLGVIVLAAVAQWCGAWLPAAAHAVPVDPQSAAAPTQSVSGGGIGSRSADPAPVTLHQGNYSSQGQLGRGAYAFTDGDADGDANLIRSDGMQMLGTTHKAPGACGAIPVSTYCLIVTLDGSADITHAVLKLAVLVDFGLGGRTSFLMHGILTLDHRLGYAVLGANGTTYAFGGLDHLGDAPTVFATDLELTPSQNGVWIVNAFGDVFAFGDAHSYGSAKASALSKGEIVTSISATPSGHGYWLFTSKGRALTFGDARFFGDLVATPLNGSVVGSVATPTGKGYYMVARDGGVFAFGDARFRGSMGNARLNRPVVGLVPTPDNTGYWLVASDGGVFSFNAQFFGSMGGQHLNRPINTMVRYGEAYLMIASDGGVFNFSSAPFFGSLGGQPVTAPIVSAVAAS